MVPSCALPGLVIACAIIQSHVISAANIQKPNLQLPPDASANAQHVIDIFKSAYGSYKTYAWGHDALAPLTKGYIDDTLILCEDRNGWGATIVDSLSTMYIMGLEDLFKEGVEFTLGIDFSRSKTNDTISLFESTIRYLGSMLSVYELDGQKDIRLVNKARELADKLIHGWVGNNDLPYNELDFATNRPVIDVVGIGECTLTTRQVSFIPSLAVAGSLVLEWYKLSEHTGNNTYRIVAEKAMRRIGMLPSPLPGLPAQLVDPRTNKPNDTIVTWGGGTDSYFEYLIKYGRLTNNADTVWVKNWLTAVDSSIIHLAQEPVGTDVEGLLYLGDWADGAIRHIGSHLACFHGGNWIMGGRLTDNDTIFNYGLKLADSCWNTYERTATGLGPEIFGYVGPDGDYAGLMRPTSADLEFYKKNGFYSYGGYQWAHYDLRPEVLESNFYAWRATGDIKYQKRAHAALTSIEKYCKVENGYAGLSDVRYIEQPDYIDQTETFLFAEVLKYLYLTFVDPSVIHLDKWVLNTEAHPFIAPPSLGTYSITPWVGITGSFNLRPGNAAWAIEYLRVVAWIAAMLLLGACWRLRHKALKRGDTHSGL
ncbi:Mannosyl-oligosaccharide alpha-1,2-mannosidase [Ceratobasidium theobromae]|uniref:alpha-1,2-Mannosidase n=1 Tax=Ceratobasidium theobromae TaxID=1582974 RepID=A0A5N5QT33_9AGAM|nr:Mannosyl-oligosaccharide alpha-1,2-mannosidase [Ceratobasidium theobromae]